MYLTICDTKQVQSYIFNSNRLAENVGASYLVAQATSAWIAEALPERHNVRDNGRLDDSLKIENGLCAELIYCGGGNALILFEDEDSSKQFARNLSRKVIEHAPGLEILIQSVPFKKEESLSEKLDLLFSKLKKASHFRTHSSPLPALAVTASSNTTGKPTVRSESTGLVDAEVAAKTFAAQSSERWLLERVPISDSDFCYPRDLDMLGRTTGDFSYIAIIHADGDSIGTRLKELQHSFTAPSEYRQLICALREFSRVLDSATRSALSSAVDAVASCVKSIESGSYPIPRTIPKPDFGKDSSGRTFLPLRPLIVGGDDVTVVCDARFAHSFCTLLMREFENQTKDLPDGKGKATLSAGIAIVKSHYPFARAYLLSEELLKSSKKVRKKLGIEASYLDWALIQSGLIETLDQMRDRELSVTEGKLYCRPVNLSDAGTADVRSWEFIHTCVLEFQSDDWLLRRNKLKALRDALRAGRTAVKEFRDDFLQTQKLPDVDKSKQDLCESGWHRDVCGHGDVCGYFDPLEMVDFYLPFESREGR